MDAAPNPYLRCANTFDQVSESEHEIPLTRGYPEGSAEEVRSRKEQDEAPEMQQISLRAARGTRTAAASPPNEEIENAGDEQSEDVRPVPPSPPTAMTARPQLDEQVAGANSLDHQNSGQTAQQAHIIAREGPRTRMEQRPEGRRGSAIHAAEHFGANARGDTAHHDRGGHRGRGGGQGRDGQDRSASSNNPNVEQPVMGAGQQVLGKRRHESEHVEPAGRFKFPFFGPDEYTIDRNADGGITGLTPTDPRADASNMVVDNPFGPGYMFQAEPLTQRGSDMIHQLAKRLGPAPFHVNFTASPSEDIGVGNALELVGTTSVGLPAETLPAHLLMGNHRDQSQNQNQNQNRPPRPRSKLRSGPYSRGARYTKGT